ncbi:LysR family transcriptional regulator [Hungatella effluvii]|uniref:LysR family transcriptional regulator n=1 Tax=Hungatella effluvii TaxID=1096246 RepID=UPI002A839F2A|nr:LysR family transcriptional regulator [Hungatella effluvii]
MLSDKFRVFTAVCECGGLTKAGEKLFISQPAISRCIKNLEEEMGTKLIAFRFGQMKKMHITRHGEILLKHCQRVILEEERLKQELAECENYILPFEPYKVIKNLCDDPDYVMGKRLNQLVSSIAQTRGERDRLYNTLRDDQNVRKKVFESGQRRFYCYHIGDVEKYIENMKID